VGPRDEIDLIARSGNMLVFIEVKTRLNEEFGRPLAAVDRRKRFRTARAAIRYLKKLKKQPASFRFDVVEIIGHPGGRPPVVRHIENAFPLPKNFRVP
jgi:putative endonuclease